MATTGANLTLDAGTGGIQAASPGEIACDAVVTLDTSGPIGSSSSRVAFDATTTPAQVIVGSVTQPTATYLAGLGSLNLGSVTSIANNGPLDVTALGNLTVLAGATLNAGAGALSLAADTNAAGAGDDGVGSLSVQANAALYGGTIALRGADMNLDPAATVGNAGSGVVTTLAGSAGKYGSSDGTGSAARFDYPSGVAVDSAGNVYVADKDNDEIRKITPSGLVTTLAGSAEQYGSSNGSGSAARFDYPSGVAVDSAGNVYVADDLNSEIRKITPAGVVTTLAGSAAQQGSSNGTGSAARFYYPSSVAVDGAGNVYVADNRNDEIRIISPLPVTNQVTIRSSLASRPMSIGGGDRNVVGINLTDAELARIQTAGTVTIGDSTQTGNIAFHTATVATTGGVGTVVVQATGGTGQIILDDQGTGPALNGNGANVSLTAGAGGIAAASANNSFAEIATTGNVTLDTSGPIGSSANRIQFDATATSAQIVVGAAVEPSGTYLDGLGNLNLGNVTSLASNGPLDVTARGNLTVVSGATLDTGTGSLSLAADTQAGGAGDDGVGTLSVQANSVLDAATIALRGADMNFDPAATVGSAASGVVTSQVTIRSSLPSRPMGIGGGNSDVAGINLTDAELTCIQTAATGTVTIGDSTQTGNITFKTARVAATAGAGTVVVQATGGAGQIVLNDQGTGPALDGNGGTVQLTPGSGGVAVIQSSSAAGDVAIVSNGFGSPAAPLSLSLNFAPTFGTLFTLVSNTATPASSNPIAGAFSNLPAGGTLSATYAGITHIFVASYGGGDGNDLVLTDITTVTATTVSSSQTSVVYGTPLTFTATVTAQGGGAAPTAGSVDFYDTTTGTDLGLGTFGSSAGATSTWSLATGVKTFHVTAADIITATYTPGSGFVGSSGTTAQTVTASPSRSPPPPTPRPTTARPRR